MQLLLQLLQLLQMLTLHAAGANFISRQHLHKSAESMSTSSSELVELTSTVLQRWNADCLVTLALNSFSSELSLALTAMLTQLDVPFQVKTLGSNTPTGSRTGRRSCELMLVVLSSPSPSAALITPSIDRSAALTTRLLFFTPPGTPRVILHQLATDQLFSEQLQLLILNPLTDGKIELLERCLYCAFLTSPPAEGDYGRGLRSLDIWSASTGFRSNTPLFSDQARYRNLNRFVLRVVSLAFRPFSDYAKTSSAPSAPTQIRDSVDARLLDLVTGKFNCTYILREPVDGNWGLQLENGSWNGELQMIRQHEADMTLVLSVTGPRMADFDMTAAYQAEVLTFITKMPGLRPQWQALSRPFSGETWSLLLLSLLFAGPAVWFFKRLIPQQELGEQAWEGPNPTFQDIFFSTFASMLQKPSTIVPKPASTRMLLLSWWLYCLLVSTFYSGSLVAYLSFPGLNPTIDTLEQLSLSNYRWGTLDAYGSEYQLFRDSTDSVYRTLFARMEFFSESRLMDEVARGQFALIGYETHIRHLHAVKKADPNWTTEIHFPSVSFFPNGFGWALRKGSQLRPHIDRLFGMLLQGGFVPLWLEDVLHTSACEASVFTQLDSKINRSTRPGVEFVSTTTREPQPLRLYHLQSIFLLAGGGLVFALLVFVAEVVSVPQGRAQSPTLQPRA